MCNNWISTTYGGYIAIFGRVMDKHHYHLLLQWRDKVDSWRATQTHSIKWMFLHMTDKRADSIIIWEQHCYQRASTPLSLLCTHPEFVSEVTLPRLSDGLPIMHCFKRERGAYVTSRWEGSNSCTLAQHPSSCPPFMQQLARWAGHVLAFKRFISINRNKVQSHYFNTIYSQSSINHQMQWNDANVILCM